MSHPETSSPLLRLSHYGVKENCFWILTSLEWHQMPSKIMILGLVKRSTNHLHCEIVGIQIWLRLHKNSGPSLSFLRLSTESDSDRMRSYYKSGQKALSAWFLLCWSRLNSIMGRLSRATCTAHLMSAPDQQRNEINVPLYILEKLRSNSPIIYSKWDCAATKNKLPDQVTLSTFTEIHSQKNFQEIPKHDNVVEWPLIHQTCFDFSKSQGGKNKKKK